MEVAIRSPSSFRKGAAPIGTRPWPAQRVQTKPSPESLTSAPAQ